MHYTRCGLPGLKRGQPAETKDETIQRLIRQRDEYRAALEYAMSLIPNENLNKGVINASNFQKSRWLLGVVRDMKVVED